MEVTEVKPVIAQVFPFAEHREAHPVLKSGNFVGKVVIDVAN